MKFNREPHTIKEEYVDEGMYAEWRKNVNINLPFLPFWNWNKCLICEIMYFKLFNNKL